MLDMRRDYDAVRIDDERKGLVGRKARVAEAIASLYRGDSVDEVAKCASVMPGTVRRWAAAFNEGGLEGAFTVTNGQTYDLRTDYDANGLRMAAESAIYPAQKARLLAIASMYDGVSTKELVRLFSVAAGTLAEWRDDFNSRGLQADVVVPDHHLQANFVAKNPRYPLSAVLKLAKRTIEADKRLKLDVIVMSYRNRSVEVIADLKKVSRAKVASWIKAFNATGPSAFDTQKEAILSSKAYERPVPLPSGYDKDVLRAAAAEAPSEEIRVRLLALASLFETRLVSAACSYHGVSRSDLKLWLGYLERNGIEGVAYVKPPLVSPEELERAVHFATSKREANLFRAAVAVVVDGETLYDAAHRWPASIPALSELVLKVRAKGVAPLLSEGLSVKHDADAIRVAALSADIDDIPVILALAAVAEGKPAWTVVNDHCTPARLKEMKKRLNRLPKDFVAKRAVSTVEPSARAKRETPTRNPRVVKKRQLPIRERRVVEEREVRTTPPRALEESQSLPAEPKKPKITRASVVAKEKQEKAKKLRRLTNWTAATHNPFLAKVRDLVAARISADKRLDGLLTHTGIPLSLVDKWVDGSNECGLGFLVGLGSSGARESAPGSKPYERVLHLVTDREAKRRLAGIVARMNGATSVTAAEIAGVPRKVFVKFENGDGDMDGLTLDNLKTTYLGKGGAVSLRPGPSTVRVLGQPEPIERQVGPTSAAISMRKDYDLPHVTTLRATAKRKPLIAKYRVLEKAYQGLDINEIVATEGVSPTLVSRWLTEFNDKGLMGLWEA